MTLNWEDTFSMTSSKAQRKRVQEVAIPLVEVSNKSDVILELDLSISDGLQLTNSAPSVIELQLPGKERKIKFPFL